MYGQKLLKLKYSIKMMMLSWQLIMGLGCLILYLGNGLDLKGRFPNALVLWQICTKNGEISKEITKFSDLFGDEFREWRTKSLRESPNLVLNIEKHSVNHQSRWFNKLCDFLSTNFVTKSSPNWATEWVSQQIQW